jgi:hypothetical protein
MLLCTSNRYLTLVSKTKEPVDSLWISKDHTAFFQMTVNPEPGLNGHGMIELVHGLPHDAKKHLCIVWVVPSDDKRTKDFKSQKPTFPIGTPQAQIDEVTGYHQYLYRCRLEDLNMIGMEDSTEPASRNVSAPKFSLAFS